MLLLPALFLHQGLSDDTVYDTWEEDDVEFGVNDDFVICHDIFIHDKDDNTYEKLINKIVFS